MPRASELTCKEVVERVSDLLGDTMSAEDYVRFEQHLLACPPCTLHLRQMKTTIAFAAALREPGAATEAAVKPEVMAAFRAWKAR